MKIYLKSVLAGAAAFAVTVFVFSGISVAVMWRFPEVAERIFRLQRHELGWGAFYEVDLPMWHTVILGMLAFAIAFGWTLRRASLRM